MSLARAIEHAIAGEEVPGGVLEAAFGEIVDGAASPVGIAALLVALRMKGETVGEIVAAARALRPGGKRRQGNHGCRRHNHTEAANSQKTHLLYLLPDRAPQL